ncbi:hypothetical protein FCN23_09520 [Campylobacter jejuni]|nr:hypothetical protein FCN23_09520 [Campylobacter jejuni]
MQNEAEDFVKKCEVVCCSNCMGLEMFLAWINNRQEARGNAANMDAYAEGDGGGSADMEVKMVKVMARGR